MSRRIARSQARKLEEAEERQEEEIIDVEGRSDSMPFQSKYSIEPPKIIDLFEMSFKNILDSEDLQKHIQSVKGDLYNRNYMSAFGNDDKRFAYASRWTPARALCYSSLFATLEPIRLLLEKPEGDKRVLCVGGGAASELVGLAAVFCRLKEYCSKSNSSLQLDIIDIADWSTIVGTLTSYVKENWIYNAAGFNTNFIHDDILTADVAKLDYPKLDLITLLFTTNELFCEKRAQTVQFLQSLNTHCRKGCYLLIAESAGSYSNITIGTKKFPVQFLIDMILIGKPGENSGSWEIVQQSESCWYRVNKKETDYKMKLENMRFFYRLYKKK